MKIIVLTGQIGSGKSTIAQYLSELNYNVYDSDDIVRDLQRPGRYCYRRIVRRFQGVVEADGELDRYKLSKLVFGPGNSANLQALNRIVHPFVYWATWQAIVRNCLHLRCIYGMPKRCKYNRRPAGVVLVIPLHFETRIFQFLPAVDVQISSQSEQIFRLVHRGLSEAESAYRISAQMSREERAKRAQKVVFNDEADGASRCAAEIDDFAGKYRGGLRYILVCNLGRLLWAMLLGLAILSLYAWKK